VISLWDVGTFKNMISLGTKHAPRGVSPEVKCGPSRKNIPKVSPQEETPRNRCVKKGKTSPRIKFPPKGCTPRERCAELRKFETS